MRIELTCMLQDENVSQAITQGGGCLTLHSKWKSAFDDSEASDNETEMKGENLASPEHAKQAGAGGDAEQVAATTRALELSRITENTSCKEEGAGKGESDKKQSLHIDIQLPLPGSNVAKASSSPEQSKPVVIPPPPKIEPPPPHANIVSDSYIFY